MAIDQSACLIPLKSRQIAGTPVFAPGFMQASVRLCRKFVFTRQADNVVFTAVGRAGGKIFLCAGFTLSDGTDID